MFGLKIFVRVQTFRRVPPVLPRSSCHPVERKSQPGSSLSKRKDSDTTQSQFQTWLNLSVGNHRFKTPTEKKEAISLAQLEKVVRAASKNYNWEDTDLPNHRLAALITLMFATAARFEEAKELKCGQLVFDKNRCVIQFRKGKTYQFGEIGLL